MTHPSIHQPVIQTIIRTGNTFYKSTYCVAYTNIMETSSMASRDNDILCLLRYLTQCPLACTKHGSSLVNITTVLTINICINTMKRNYRMHIGWWGTTVWWESMHGTCFHGHSIEEMSVQSQSYGTRTCFTCSTRTLRQEVLLGHWVSWLHVVTILIIPVGWW